MNTDIFRMWVWALLAIIFLAGVWIVSPAQLPVVLYKLGLVTTAGYGGYWLDRTMFPYARPSAYLPRDRADDRMLLGAILMMIRRALVVAACMLSVGMGL